MPIGLVILSSIVSISGQQQPTNSESGKARDQKAIDDAVNGWWTASMKTHDQGSPGGAKQSSDASFTGASIRLMAANGTASLFAVMPST